MGQFLKAHMVSDETMDHKLKEHRLVYIQLMSTSVWSLPGSDLELVCQVLTGCEMAASTVVTWLVNGRPVESSYLRRRSLQGGRR